MRRLLLLLVCLAALAGADVATAATRAADTRVVRTRVTYETVGALALPAEVIRPARARPGERRPVVLVVHGGGWWSGRYTTVRKLALPFVRAGYVAVLPGYRLACAPADPEQPAPFTTTRRELLPFCGNDLHDAVADVAAAWRWTRTSIAAHGGDPLSINVLGTSAGGHLAATLLARRPRSMVLISAPVDLTWFARRGSSFASTITNAVGCAYAACPGAWRRLSPALRLPPRVGPVLLTGGRSERVVPTASTLRFERDLRRRGARIARIPALDWCHGNWCLTRRTASGRTVLAEVLRWVESRQPRRSIAAARR